MITNMCCFVEGEVAFFSAKHWDRRNRVDLIESATPCHDAQVVGPYRDSNPLRLTILAAMSEDYTTAPQHLQATKKELNSYISTIDNYGVTDQGQKKSAKNWNAILQLLLLATVFIAFCKFQKNQAGTVPSPGAICGFDTTDTLHCL